MIDNEKKSIFVLIDNDKWRDYKNYQVSESEKSRKDLQGI